jgi:hypothetical protein
MSSWLQRGPVLWLLLCPLIVGIARGSGYLILRPNEFLLLVLTGLLLLVSLRKLAEGRLQLPSPNTTDGAVLGLVVCGTLLPLLLGFGRGTALSLDDFLYSFVFLKYALLYFYFRLSVQTLNTVKLSMAAVLTSSAIVAIIALLQAKELFGVPWFLATFYDKPFEGSSGPYALRASSTIASSFGLADSMAMAMSLAVAVSVLHPTLSLRQRAIYIAGAVLFLLAALASGSFSGVIACGVVFVVTGLLVGRFRQLVALALPVATLGMAVLWPTISARLDGFSGYRSLPRSWLGRIDNLERFFWPELSSGWNWLLGVRPAARVPAPEAWRDWVYIESGYTWLFWTGGFPLFLAFLYFLWAVTSDLLPGIRHAAPDMRALRISALAGTAMIAVLMLFDPHLTVRGCADLYFPLLALAVFRPVSKPGFANDFLQQRRSPWPPLRSRLKSPA